MFGRAEVMKPRHKRLAIKLVVFVVLALVGTLILSACGDDEPEPAPTPVAATPIPTPISCHTGAATHGSARADSGAGSKNAATAG